MLRSASGTRYSAALRAASSTSFISQKQYELVNHLANVQETVSDKKFAKDLNGDGNRDEYRAASVMVYDYYPYGQFMPGRSLDTAGLCVTYNNYMEIPSYRYNNGGTLGTGGGGGATPYGADTLTNLGSKGVSAHGLGGGLVYTISGITDQSIQINTYFHYLSGTDTITAWLGTNTSSTGTQLGSTRASYISPTSTLPISVGGTVASPATITLVYKMANGSSRTLFSIDSVNYTTLSYTLVTSTFSRCGDPKDKYEFGFNGQMKDNEIAGVGNHNTAKFWEYSTQYARRWNLDPVPNSSISNYVVFDGNPILKNDISGNTPGDYYKSDGTHLGSDGKEDNKTYTATGVTQDADGKKTFTDASELDIKHTDFQKFAGLVHNEDNSTIESSYGTASAVVNYNNFKNSHGRASTLSGLLNGKYSSAAKTFTADNNDAGKLQATAAVINALNGGHDYSNGATHWDGYDAAGAGFNHTKPKNQGVEISQTHFNAFRAAWPNGKLERYSGGTYTSFSTNYSAGIHKATGSNAGRVLYKSSAVLGNTIFWKPNIDPVIVHPPKIRDFMGENPFILEHPNEGYNWKNY